VAGAFKCSKCTRWHASPASGLLIAPDGTFVTTYHVVNDAKKHTLIAMTRDGTVYPVGEVLAASREDDVVILRLGAAGVEFRPVALSDDAPVGALVCVISHPAKRFYVLTQGVVSRYFRRTKDGQRVTRMSITADFARGSSGAPVFNERGAVVGLVGSTESVYYKVTKGKKENLQMVFKQCAPASSILKLIRQ
jgi:S1-C subfamily serine protease